DEIVEQLLGRARKRPRRRTGRRVEHDVDVELARDVVPTGDTITGNGGDVDELQIFAVRGVARQEQEPVDEPTHARDLGGRGAYRLPVPLVRVGIEVLE